MKIIKTILTIILAIIISPLAMWYETKRVKKDPEAEENIPERNRDGYLM